MKAHIRDAIIEETTRQIVEGLHGVCGILPREASSYLARSRYQATTARERGLRTALQRLGFLERGFLGRFKRTRMAETRGFETMVEAIARRTVETMIDEEAVRSGAPATALNTNETTKR